MGRSQRDDLFLALPLHVQWPFSRKNLCSRTFAIRLRSFGVWAGVVATLLVLGGSERVGQTRPATVPSKADVLRVHYGRYRANNDLLYYHLDVPVNPEKKLLSGKNTIRFKMLKDDNRIQLDLQTRGARRRQDSLR